MGNIDEEWRYLHAELKVLIRITAKANMISDEDLADIWIDETNKIKNAQSMRQLLPKIEKERIKQTRLNRQQLQAAKSVEQAEAKGMSVKEMEKDKQLQRFAIQIENAKRMATKDPTKFMDDNFVPVSTYPKQVILLENEVGYNTKTNTRYIKITQPDVPRTKKEKDKAESDAIKKEMTKQEQEETKLRSAQFKKEKQEIANQIKTEKDKEMKDQLAKQTKYIKPTVKPRIKPKVDE